MTAYRVEVDGNAVWSDTIEDDGGTTAAFPAEYLARPVEPASGQPHPSPRYLYIDDELVGIQRCHADEADQLTAAAETAETAGDAVGAAQLRTAASQATVNALIAATHQTPEA